MTMSLMLLGLFWQAGTPEHRERAIFPDDPTGHNHASCVVSAPDGGLLVAWYRGSGEREADDVRILGARLRPGAEAWDPLFEMADTPGYPDCNPALFAPPDGTLWLFWPTILDHRWESALLKFARSEDWAGPGPPRWGKEGVIHLTPTNFAEHWDRAVAATEGPSRAIAEGYKLALRGRIPDPLYQRLGWMPRAHPVALPSGRWLLPLYTDTFSVSIMAISDDRGATWSTGEPIIGFGNIQPSVVRRDDGTLAAFMREAGATHRIRVADSADEGKSWSAVRSTDLPNPGAGVEAIRLQSGAWLMACNDDEAGRHSLVVALSRDQGRTWPVRRHLARTERGQGNYHYPSMIQTPDGLIHATYTAGRKHRGETIRHATFNEAWVGQGD